jgi:hypothetical protein
MWITFWLAVFVEVHFRLQLTQLMRDASCACEKSLDKSWILGRFSLAFGVEVDSASSSVATELSEHDKIPRLVISSSESLDNGTSRVAIGGGVGYVKLRFIPDIFCAV